MPYKKFTPRPEGAGKDGKGIKTDQITFEFFVDLQKTIHLIQAEGMTYTIIPDCAGFWVKSDQATPFSIDWPQETELAHPDYRKIAHLFCPTRARERNKIKIKKRRISSRHV